MTTLTVFHVDHNKKKIRLEFKEKQALHLEYSDLESIWNIVCSHNCDEDKYDMYLALVPFTTMKHPVYL